MVLPLAPGPLLRFTRRAPKKLSSTSISPEIGDSISHSSAILFLTKRKYLLTVLRFKPVNWAILVASIFSEKHFNNFFEHFNKMNKNQGIAHKWIESKTERILVINVDVGKKDTLDIEINKKMVTVKIKKVEAKSSFSSNQSVSIPIDVDTSKAEVKNKDGKIMIIFPKINNKKIRR